MFQYIHSCLSFSCSLCLPVAKAETDNLNNQIYFFAGGLYRYNDALIPVIKLDVYQLGIGLSYDINISKLTVASGSRGGFELSLNYKLNLTGSSPDERQVECPAPGKGF